jgi:26S proteasome regulatory subunit N2
MMKGETVISEAAALGIGMLMAGSGNLEVITQLLEFGADTDREKIQISIGQAVAMIMFGQEDQADTVIE